MDLNQNPSSPESPQTNSNVGTVVTPTAEPKDSEDKQLFQPNVQPVREQSVVASPEFQNSTPQPDNQQQLNTTQNVKSSKPQKQKSKVLVVAVVAVVLLLVMTVAAVLVANSGDKKPVQETTDTSQQGTSGPQPASALDVEQSNNSINQDMSTINDENDFPVTQIDDKSLGL